MPQIKMRGMLRCGAILQGVALGTPLLGRKRVVAIWDLLQNTATVGLGRGECLGRALEKHHRRRRVALNVQAVSIGWPTISTRFANKLRGWSQANVLCGSPGAT